MLQGEKGVGMFQEPQEVSVTGVQWTMEETKGGRRGKWRPGTAGPVVCGMEYGCNSTCKSKLLWSFKLEDCIVLFMFSKGLSGFHV